MKDLLIIGESNPYGDEGFALYHLPRHASGNRLREHMGLCDCTYDKLEKLNLCPGPWRLQLARNRAMVLLTEYRVLVLLGIKVRQAFNGPPAWEARVSEYKRVMISLPHPSGLNRQWFEPGARDRARALLKAHAPGVPWGEA